MRKAQKALKQPLQKQSVGFGVPKPITGDTHYFVLDNIKQDQFWIYEYLGDRSGPRLRAKVAADVWRVAAKPVTTLFNRRLKDYGLAQEKWDEGGITPIDRLLGKELCVLVWALSGADLTFAAPTILKNWVALRPEDRWWLYGMALVSSSWRMALSIALQDQYKYPTE